jgi:glutaminyl-peptide cyclotransferase
MPLRITLRAKAATALLVALAIVPIGCGEEDGSAAAAGAVPRANVDSFDGRAAYRLVESQVAIGERPAGSAASRRLAERLRRKLPNGRLVPIGGGLRNVVGRVRGKEPSRTVIVAAHYDTKDLPGFVGAVDGASGTAVVAQIARTLKPRRIGPTVVYLLLDGEEAPAGVPDSEFERYGLRGSKAAAPRYRDAEAMILLDFVGERGLRIPYEGNSDRRLWGKLRAAARRVGVGKVFPDSEQGALLDDHIPFANAGVPSIDLIDFSFRCWHQRCDDLSQISARSLDATGETVLELVRRL